MAKQGKTCQEILKFFWNMKNKQLCAAVKWKSGFRLAAVQGCFDLE
jgi:hypothetical protein